MTPALHAELVHLAIVAAAGFAVLWLTVMLLVGLAAKGARR